MQALGHCAIRNGHDVLFTTQGLMLSQLHAARATNTFDRQFAKLAGVGLLIIDDFGLKPLKPSQDEGFQGVISERYERKSRCRFAFRAGRVHRDPVEATVGGKPCAIW